MKAYRIQAGASDSIYKGSDGWEALDNYAKDAGYLDSADVIDQFGEADSVEELPEAFREEVLDYIMEHEDVVENGTIHVYTNLAGELTHTIGSMEFHDDEIIHLASFKIWNESKPYDREAFEWQFDNQQ